MKQNIKEILRNLIICLGVLIIVCCGSCMDFIKHQDDEPVYEAQPLTILSTTTTSTTSTTLSNTSTTTNSSVTSTTTTGGPTTSENVLIQLENESQGEIETFPEFYESEEVESYESECMTENVVTTETATTITTDYIESVEIEIEMVKKPEEIVVYKPSTHYIHRKTCHWYTDECYEIESTEGLQVLYCTECKPDMEVYEYYQPAVATANDNDRELLAQIVWHEAGSDWIGTYDKAMVAAGVMNRVNDERFPNTVYGVLVQPGQFSGFTPWTCSPTQSCYDAVDYYFAHTNEFGSHNSWYGVNGQYNVFYYQ